MAMKNQDNKVGVASYQFYGQAPMTEAERAAFLQAARHQERAYDDYLARLADRAEVSHLPHEHLPDMDDPQHLFRDPNHPINIRSEIAHGERALGELGLRIQDELNSPFFSAGRLKVLQESYDGQLTILESKREIVANRNAARDLESNAVKTPDLIPEMRRSADRSVAWHQAGGIPLNAPLQLTPAFKRALVLDMAELRSRESAPATFAPNVAETSARALYTSSGDAPTETSWHKKATINPYSSGISEDQLMRTVASDRTGNKRLSAQAGEVATGVLQQAAEMNRSVQAGDIDWDGKALGNSRGNVFSVLPVMGKAFTAHTLAPLGSEALFQIDAAKDVMDQAEKDHARGLLTQEQLAIIDDNTKRTAAEASAAAIFPEPGLGMDKIVQEGDRRLVSGLLKAGLSNEQAQQYEMGSMIESGHRLAALVSDSLANRRDVKQVMDADGAVPLSMALNINQSQLRQFGAMSAALGGEALKNEIARNPVFERLAHLSPGKLEVLSQMAAAGIDPLVVDRGHITTTSNRPAQLSADSKAAFIQSANYIMQSGDAAFRVPGNRPVELKAMVESFAMTYERLAQDGGLSMQDKAALRKSIETLSEGIGTDRLHGVVARYEAAHPSPQLPNDAEHAMSVQR